MGMHLAGILILNEDQPALATHVGQREKTVVLTRPVTLKHLATTLGELVQ